MSQTLSTACRAGACLKGLGCHEKQTGAGEVLSLPAFHRSHSISNMPLFCSACQRQAHPTLLLPRYSPAKTGFGCLPASAEQLSNTRVHLIAARRQVHSRPTWLCLRPPASCILACRRCLNKSPALPAESSRWCTSHTLAVLACPSQLPALGMLPRTPEGASAACARTLWPCAHSARVRRLAGTE